MDADLAAEQAFIDDAYAWLAWMRARAEELAAGIDPKELDLLHALRRRAATLTDGGRPLCFGRIDLDGGEVFHVGRRHVENADGEPVVVEWRAPVAVPFYRASPLDRLGLTRRRQFMLDGRRIQSMADDLFGEGAVGEVPRLRGGDALLAELERSRGAEMLDIVATIQAEQDEVIRAPLEGVLVVQGGPGSGKTAVGLHRAAFLLYDEEILARQGVLVLGPNRLFLRYIAQVLPSLGEEAVVQTTVRDLAPGVRVVADDHPDAERIKGDVRMADVLARALEVGRRPLEGDLSVPVGLRRLVLPAADANGLAADVAARRLPYETGRSVLREALNAAVVALNPPAGPEEAARTERAVRASPETATALDRLWPSVSPAALVRSLRHPQGRAAPGRPRHPVPRRAGRRAPAPHADRAARDPRCPTGAARLGVAPSDPARPRHAGASRGRRRRSPCWTRRRRWSRARRVAYGHVVVDEAQDLSPMQARMIGRRAPSGSVTVLGDLAQASGAWAPATWDEVTDHLPTPRGSRVVELRLGYRSPG